MTPHRGLATAPQGGLWSLDLVRGAAAQMVLVGHAINVFLPHLFMQNGPRGLLEARAGFFYVQNFAVMMFFYVSGYLITASFLAKRERPGWGLAQFLGDRFARIFTALVPLILILAVFDPTLLEGSARRYEMGAASSADALRALTMLYDHPLVTMLARATSLTGLAGGAFGSAPQLWTVVIEWWIYVVFGSLALLTSGRGWGLVARLGLLGLALPVVAAAFTSHPILPLAWIVGMVVRLFEPRLRAVSGVWLCGAAAIGTAVALVRLAQAGWDAYDTIFGLATAPPLFAFIIAERKGLIRRPGSALVHRPVAYMADVSYTLYLVHLSILFHVALALPSLVGQPLAMLAMLAACNLAAWLFFWAFDRHHHRVAGAIRRWLDSQTEPALPLL